MDVAGGACWRCGYAFTDEELAKLPYEPKDLSPCTFTYTPKPIRGPTTGALPMGIPEVIGGVLGAAVLFTPIILLLSWCSSSSTKSEADYAKEAAAMADARRNGEHCLSGWDGSHPRVVEAVKRTLRDPASFEHVETRVLPVDSTGKNSLMMQFRAKNGFGGVNVGMAKATVDNSTCSVSIEQIES